LARKLFVYDEARDEFRFVGGRVGAAKPAASGSAAPADAADAAGEAREPPRTPAQLDRVAAQAALDERPALAPPAARPRPRGTGTMPC
jgi:hypothetical protein